MDRFQAVATMYLDNYIFLVSFLGLNKQIPSKEVIKKMLLSSCQRLNLSTIAKRGVKKNLVKINQVFVGICIYKFFRQ